MAKTLATKSDYLKFGPWDSHGGKGHKLSSDIYLYKGAIALRAHLH